MDTKKEKKIIHHAWAVVGLLVVIMVGAMLEGLNAVRGSTLYYISGALTVLTFIGASGYCSHTRAGKAGLNPHALQKRRSPFVPGTCAFSIFPGCAKLTHPA